MARLYHRQGRSIVAELGVLLALAVSGATWAASDTLLSTILYERPVLIVEPGLHTAALNDVAVDAAGRFMVTGADDKTLRIWALSDGKLLQTIRVPAGPGNVGKIYAVALSPDGALIAAGGWTGEKEQHLVYLFDRSTGTMTKRLPALPNTAFCLAFSVDGRWLAVGLGGTAGLHIYDRDQQWAEAFADPDYTATIKGVAFAVDGRVATASFDGKVRLYNPAFTRIATHATTRGTRLRELAFNPEGSVLAVGDGGTPAVDLLDAQTLAVLPGPDTTDLTGGNVSQVAWSTDGRTLFAGGTYQDDTGAIPILAWTDAGRGPRRVVAVAPSTIMALKPLAAGQLLVASAEPSLSVVAPNGETRTVSGRPGASFEDQSTTLQVAADGMLVDFHFAPGGHAPLRFDVRALRLLGERPNDARTAPPRQDGLPIAQWQHSDTPTLAGAPLPLENLEISRSLAVHPDGQRFVLGTSWTLRAMDATGTGLWQRAVPGEVWAVHITGDGRLVVAAYHDGTLRWHRMDDGRELLALMVLSDKTNWVAWTPEGFYTATAGAHGVLRWHVNRGFEAAGETVPVAVIPKLKRPDALPLVLQELETVRALGLADLAAARTDVRRATGMTQAPGARLHILTIGVSEYGDQAAHLRLHFAHKDAQDVANALLRTQDSVFNTRGGLYAAVRPMMLHNTEAGKGAIMEALAAMQRNMAQSHAGEDLAVILFSGHGAMFDERWYLLPYGVDARTPAQLKASAIPASEFQAEVAKLAAHGRVLVLLDACRSGALTADGTTAVPNAERLRAAMTLSNVTVLTSSSAATLSREEPDWQQGAFTKVLLEALGSAADTNANGLISMNELTTYLAEHLPRLTEDRQRPSIELRFHHDLFVAGD